MGFEQVAEALNEIIKNERESRESIKKLEDNEKQTVVLQRRALRATRDIKKGEKLSFEDFEFQRPCPVDAFCINDYKTIIGKHVNRDIVEGDYFKNGDTK